MRVLLDLYATDGHFHGCVRTTEEATPVEFSGVVELLAALEQLDAGRLPDDDFPPTDD